MTDEFDEETYECERCGLKWEVDELLFIRTEKALLCPVCKIALITDYEVEVRGEE